MGNQKTTTKPKSSAKTGGATQAARAVKGEKETTRKENAASTRGKSTTAMGLKKK